MIVDRQPAIMAIVADTIKIKIKPIVYFRLPTVGNSQGNANNVNADVDIT